MAAVLSLDLVDCFRLFPTLSTVLENAKGISDIERAGLAELRDRCVAAVMAEAKLRSAAGMEPLSRDEVARLDPDILKAATSMGLKKLAKEKQ